jgi:exodeoxyribonuclease III
MSHLVFSWNIDSLKEEKWQKLVKFIEDEQPAVICLNETKSKAEKMEQLFKELTDYDYVLNSHSPPQYHGVAMLIHKDLDWERLDVNLDCEARYDNKSKDPTIGRLIAIRLKKGSFPTTSASSSSSSSSSFSSSSSTATASTDAPTVLEDVIIVATYSPNSGIDRYNPLKNLTYRIESWDAALFNYLLELENKYKNVIWIGDINVAPTERDVSHPKAFKNHAGFTQEERDSFGNFLQSSNWIDIWRHQHPNDIAYTFKGYRSYRYRLRLDNCVITPSLLTFIKESKIYPDKDFMESDHNPVSILIKLI